MSFYQNYLAQLQKDFPEAWKSQPLAPLLNPNLISSQKFGIRRSAVQKIEAFVTAIYKLRNQPEYQQHILQSHELFSNSEFTKPLNFSALMSFDFHLLDDEHPKLIEVNTNASSSLIITESYRTQGLKNIFARGSEEFETDILHCFQNEFELWKKTTPNAHRELKVIAIVDENPPAQKLFIEFLLYQDLFSRAGYTCVIADPKDLSIKGDRLVYQQKLEVDLIYNRHTDFYLSTPVSANLKEAYLKSYACFSPHPFEYALLADKQRLFELSTQPKLLETLSSDEQQLIHSVLLKSYDVRTAEDKDWFWKNKKGLFFKPKRSFGGKASYRGQGITQGVFSNIVAGEYLAQEFAPPSEIEVTLEDQTQASFKYDLRFYVYQGRIQLAATRLWRGQLTNIHSPGGGLAPLFVIS